MIYSKIYILYVIINKMFCFSMASKWFDWETLVSFSNKI